MQTYHILLIEDDLSIVENLTAYLTAESFSVVSASGQDQALSLLETFHPDLVLLDITLAQGNGYSTCTAIKKTSQIPVIFLTALTDEFSVVTGLDMGADDYICKPFRPRELVSESAPSFAEPEQFLLSQYLETFLSIRFAVLSQRIHRNSFFLH